MNLRNKSDAESFGYQETNHSKSSHTDTENDEDLCDPAKKLANKDVTIEEEDPDA